MSTSALRRVEFNNGTSIPIIGTGAYCSPDPTEQAQVKGWLLTALQAGFRHIDTASMYATEEAVGEAVRESGIPREDIFITTKFALTDHGRVAEALDESLARLQLPWVDLFLVHWPISYEYDGENLWPKNPDGTYRLDQKHTFKDSWLALEKVYAEGKAKAIGVSNFSIKTLEELFEVANIVPACNQIEIHPYLAQNELREYCLSKGIKLVAFVATGWDNVRKDPVILDIARKHDATANQVIHAWHIARDTVVLPKSVNPERQKENLIIPTLDDEDLQRINALDRGQRFCNGPDDKGNVLGWSVERMGW